ncbi:MAG: aminoacetone oxidase family FAD-binding enzyme, partial [Lachnospiraceae bacterium]|nr:aminoacetone oxidase family FAD-binding enzyme [Lachnospiraceae bacterium]
GAKRVILSLGGPASVYGATDTGFKVLKGFGINLEEPRPALTALTSSDKILKKMAGVRLQAAVTLSVKGRKYTDTGEIIFNDGNVSGIPVFKISRFVEKDSRPTLIADLLPSLSREEAVSFITGVLRHNPRTTYEQLLRGILNYKAVYYILERNRIDAESIAGSLTDAAAGKLVDLFKNFTLEINGTKGFESAQTSTGGALPSCLDKESLESLKVKGLYITGELVDVDGICGGYNLHFAWASGMKAGKACAESLC